MSRLDDADDTGEVAERIRRRRGGTVTPLDAMLLHSPPVADGWNSLLGAIRGHTELPASVRELAILRVAHLNGAAYEWLAHEPLGRAAGLDDEQVEAIRDAHPLDVLPPAHRAALDYTDAMTRDIVVPDEVFAGARKFFDERQTVELTATVGVYNLVSRFLVALEIDR